MTMRIAWTQTEDELQEMQGKLSASQLHFLMAIWMTTKLATTVIKVYCIVIAYWKCQR